MDVRDDLNAIQAKIQRILRDMPSAGQVAE